MTRRPLDEIEDIPLTTDTEIVPQLQELLEGATRRQLWILMLDRHLRPRPVLIPTDLPREPDPDDIAGIGDFLNCLALDHRECTLVLTFERPGPQAITARDRRWLRTIHLSAVDSGAPFRGPYLLTGETVQAVPLDEFVGAPWLDDEE